MGLETDLCYFLLACFHFEDCRNFLSVHDIDQSFQLLKCRPSISWPKHRLALPSLYRKDYPSVKQAEKKNKTNLYMIYDFQYQS